MNVRPYKSQMLGYVDLDDARLASRKFILERWSEITFDSAEEWLVKRVVPRRGVAVIYGKPATFKSFVASRIALNCAMGWPWAGHSVFKASVVYIAAEGAAGLRKRKAGYVKAYPDLKAVPFWLVSTAPNLGVEPGDLPDLIRAIENADMSPGLIVLNTLAQTLGGSDENGTGMTAFLSNAGKLAEKFGCLVLIVHHVGHGDERRMRGHSSLGGGVDAQILCERQEGSLAATLTVIKLKDDASDVQFTVRLSRIVIGYDDDGEEISTLIVEAVEETERAAKAPAPRSIPPQQRMLMAVVVGAIEEAGETFSPFGSDGLHVRAVTDNVVRARYYSRIAEQAEADEDRKKLANRQRKAFNNAVRDALKAERLFAEERDGKRLLWLG
jgi:hypothetical protein